MLRVAKRDAARFGGGRKRLHGNSLAETGLAEPVFQRLHRVVVGGHVACKIGQERFELGLTGLFIERNDLLDFHDGFCDGACFVNAQNIDACQRFNALQVVHQRFFFRQLHHTDSQRNVGQQIQSLRDHADQRSRRFFNVFFGRQIEHGPLPQEERNAHRDDDDADHLNEPRQRPHHAGVTGFAALFGVQRQFGDERIMPDLVQTRPADAGNDKAAGEQTVARTLCDFVGFAGDKRFVDLNFAGHDDGVGADLVPGGENDNVVYDERFCRDS